MSVGSNIRKRRYQLGMSQQELADAMGYKTRSTIARIESGENGVTEKKLRRFAQVLDTSPAALLGEYVPLQTQQAEPSASEHRTVVVILAGGKSARNQQNIPNQFISILGKPVIVYCMEAYQAHPAIDDIYVVCLKGWEKIVTAYAQQYGISKLRGILPAAASGILSVKSGLAHVKKLYSQEDIIIFQESTRPMVTVEMISKLLKACSETGSANICSSMRDNVQFTFVDGKATYLERDTVVDLQSPEAYRLRVITDVFETAARQRHVLQESCCVMLMYNLGYPINFIEGSTNNPKLIRQEDIAVLSALLRQEN